MSFTADLNDLVAENRNGLLGAHPSWKRVRLKEVASILNGYPFESERFSKSKGTPLIRIRDILPGKTETFYDADFDPTFIVQPGELIVGMDGDFNSAPWAGEPALLNQRVCKITPNEAVYSGKFLRHVLPGYLQAIHAQTSSVTVKHLSSRTIAEIPLPLPSLADQKTIVAEIEKQFTRLDAGVAALKRVQANLKRYRAAVLKAACEGKLVPTEAELARKEKRKFESGEELLKRILAERKAKWNGKGKYKEVVGPETEKLAPLPEGWGWASGAQLFIWASGENLTQEAVQIGQYPVYGGNGITAHHNAFVVEHPTLVIGRVGALCGNAYLTAGPAWITDNAIYATQIPSSASMKFMLLVFTRADLNKKAAGSGQPFVNQRMLNETIIPLPPLPEQLRIVAEVERRLSVVDELLATVESNLQRAARLRQAILMKAFQGPKQQ